MNVEEMRALDREMAAIMGWTLEEWSTSGVPYEPLYRTGPTSHLAVVAWRPTEDIRQAMMVEKALKAKGWLLTLEAYVKCYRAVFFGEEGYDVQGEDAEAEVAICLAAKATEAE